MNATHPTGLGEPEVPGKLSLFRPPQPQEAKVPPQPVPENPKSKPGNYSGKRIRTTLDLTWDALKIIQEHQDHYRLETGKVLPLWKAVSQMIESYGRDKKKIRLG